MAADSAPAGDATPTGSNRHELIREALQDSLGQLCGGDVPHVSEATNHGSGAPPKMSIDQWRILLETSCEEGGIQSTARGGKQQQHPQQEAMRGKPWDFEVRCIASLFNRFCRSNEEQKKNSNKKKRKNMQISNTDNTVREDASQEQQSAYNDDSKTPKASKSPKLLLTSDLGVQRTVQSACEWSQKMLPLLDDRLPRGWDCRVHPQSGFLLLVSPERALALRDAGRRPCPSCSLWPKGGEKGLWWHQQQQHGVHHASATASAAQTRVVQALVLYQEPETLSELLASLGTENSINNSNSQLQNDSNDSSISDKEKAFQYAADGDLQALRQSISEKHIDPANDIDSRGASVLLWAAGGGHIDTVRYLVEDCHCDPATKQKQHKRGFAGRTALHWACRKGHLEVVQYLLDPSTAAGGPKLLWDRTADGTNCIGWAAWQGQLDIMKWIYSTYQHQSYPEAVSLGEQNIMEDCFLTVNKFGCNALLWAAQGTADAEAMDWLVRVAKVSLTHINSNGHGILHKAGQRNRPEIASWLQSFLRELLATIDVDEIHASPLSDIPTKTMSERIMPLIGPDEEGCTPSDLAGIEGHIELAVQMWEMEKATFLAILARTQSWPMSWTENPIALLDSWGPGCGVARFRKIFEEQVSRKRGGLGQEHPNKPSKVAAI